MKSMVFRVQPASHGESDSGMEVCDALFFQKKVFRVSQEAGSTASFSILMLVWLPLGRFSLIVPAETGAQPLWLLFSDSYPQLLGSMDFAL